ncbi:MAG TPA: glyoxalase superfamily protein [Nocardioidaceae bacterium]|nr:glyoxalase superfamily protein [Nocardioidaceae bacterium]
MDWKIEVIVVPVTDVDRAKAFYVDQMGFTLDVDHHPNEHFRVVQTTPPGSGCSITFGINVGGGEPGSVKGIHLCVNDIVAALDHLESHGVKNGGIKHFDATGQMQDGPHPERIDFGSYIFLDDPDGNSWAVQEVKHNAR